MSEQKARITVSQLGKVTVEAKGITGMSCTGKTKGIIDRLGGGGEQTLKPEANMIETESEEANELFN